MSDFQYGTPLLRDLSGRMRPLVRLPLGRETLGEQYDERFIQDLIFESPSALPVSEIDSAYAGLVPVCKELVTDAGPLDALFVTPKGRIAIVEAKLWRNPEARRRVVAQVLDYAKELSKWDYEDLQREVNKNLHTKGNTLYRLVEEMPDALDEASFVDQVSRSLNRGRFLLLIVGDGIREGAATITDFLESFGRLEFTFGLVELGLYQNQEIGLLIQPRVLARTVELRRTVIQLSDGMEIRPVEEESYVQEARTSPEIDAARKYFQQFWQELIDMLELDDQSQPLPAVQRSTNLYLDLPPEGKAWISAFFMKSKQTVGVYFRLSRDTLGEELAAKLNEERRQIEEELGHEATWELLTDKRDVAVRRQFGDIHDPANRQEILRFFACWINKFVNAFRPRLERLTD